MERIHRKRDSGPPAWHSLPVFLLLAAVGGVLEAYTYLLHNGVFCNAQTGNLVLIVFNLVGGEPGRAVQHLCSVLAFVAGVCFSFALGRVIPPKVQCLWVVCAEIVCFAGLFFLSGKAPDWCVYVTASFLFAMQYNTFSLCGGVAVSTTFCSNNLRQTCNLLIAGLRERDRNKLKQSGVYASVIAGFISGAAIGALAVRWTGAYAVFFCLPFMLAVLALLLLPQKAGPGTQPPAGVPSPEEKI